MTLMVALCDMSWTNILLCYRGLGPSWWYDNSMKLHHVLAWQTRDLRAVGLITNESNNLQNDRNPMRSHKILHRKQVIMRSS